MFLAQIEQESSGNQNATASDGGMGLGQIMPSTAKSISKMFPVIGPPAPYDPAWSISALVRYDQWLYQRIKKDDRCHGFGAALKSYNGGLGFVQQQQRASPDPGKWFGLTEYIPNRQSPENFEASRMYPRKILLSRQSKYRAWGIYLCNGIK